MGNVERRKKKRKIKTPESFEVFSRRKKRNDVCSQFESGFAETGVC